MKKISTNLFCITGTTGSGKNLCLSNIMDNRKFVNAEKLEQLIYGTTRNIRENEVDGIDYHFYSEQEYEKINPKDIIEFRSYTIIGEGAKYYFTSTKDIKLGNNYICTTSPYQYESYRSWIYDQKILHPENDYNIYMIIIDASPWVRLERIGIRQRSDTACYEACRRIIEERYEFDTVASRLPELQDPNTCKNSLYISNEEEDTTIGRKIKMNKIEDFIRRKIEISE